MGGDSKMKIYCLIRKVDAGGAGWTNRTESSIKYEDLLNQIQNNKFISIELYDGTLKMINTNNIAEITPVNYAHIVYKNTGNERVYGGVGKTVEFILELSKDYTNVQIARYVGEDLSVIKDKCIIIIK